jgi:hypothetical protein
MTRAPAAADMRSSVAVGGAVPEHARGVASAQSLVTDVAAATDRGAVVPVDDPPALAGDCVRLGGRVDTRPRAPRCAFVAEFTTSEEMVRRPCHSRRRWMMIGRRSADPANYVASMASEYHHRGPSA